MPIYNIDIPAQLEDFIKTKFGTDVQSYIQAKFLRPLMSHFEEGQKEVELEKVKTVISDRVKEVHDSIKLEKKIEIIETPVAEEPASPIKKQMDITEPKG